MEPKDVFISFSFGDKEKTERIARTLETEFGISCWLCLKDIHGGQSYKQQIPEAIKEFRRYRGDHKL